MNVNFLKKVALLLFLLSTIITKAQNYESNRIYVKVKDNINLDLTYDTIGNYNNLNAKFPFLSVLGVFKIENAFMMRTLNHVYCAYIENSQNIDSLISNFSNEGEIEYAEKIPLNFISTIPNDYNSSDQWYLETINAPCAWERATANANVTIGIVDTEFDIEHIDIRDNVLINEYEIAQSGITIPDGNTNGRVDLGDVFIMGHDLDWLLAQGDGVDAPGDNNDFIDDFVGWNFGYTGVGNNDPRITTTALGNEHGTHVSGIVAAKTDNGTGIASLSDNVGIICVKTFNDYGQIVQAYDGIDYVASMGANIVNCSWGSYAYSTTNSNFINYIKNNYDINIIAAAGNNAVPNKMYPASYDLVYSVGATNINDERAFFSNYSETPHHVDIWAPGEDIYSLKPDNLYQNMSGTSMASPLVASLAGLIKSANSSLNPDDIENIISNTSTDISNVGNNSDYFMTQGRINACQAINIATGDPQPQFVIDASFICSGANFNIINTSIQPLPGFGTINSWAWTCPGATFNNSSIENPTISFPATGNYQITLTVTTTLYPTETYSYTLDVIVSTPYASIVSQNPPSPCVNVATGFLVEMEGMAPFTINYSLNGVSQAPVTANYSPFWVTVNSTTEQTITATLTGFTDNNCTGDYSSDSISFNFQECECRNNRSNIWYFGNHAGLSFNTVTGDPYPIPNGQTYLVQDNTSNPNAVFHNEGVATICDFQGNNLLYTNSVLVWDANHNVLNNTDLSTPTGYEEMSGSESSSQNSIILPAPGDNLSFYIFTIDNWDTQSGIQNHGLHYTKVKFDAGYVNPQIVEFNVPIIDGSTSSPTAYPLKESIIATKGTENNFYIITHFDNDPSYSSSPINDFYVVELDVSGVNQAYTQSSNSDHIWPRTYMKFNKEGNILAVASEKNVVEFYSFDKTNGLLTYTNSVNIDLNSLFYHYVQSAYGMEFSPNNHYLYISERTGNSLHQIDISNISGTLIDNRIDFDINNYPYVIKSLQLGPNNKLYMACIEGVYDSYSGTYNFITPNYILEIADPNAILTSATPFNRIQLTSNTFSSEGLPNFTLFDEFSLELNGGHDCAYTPIGEGYINSNVYGSYNNYYYEWSNGETTPNISGLFPGEYYLTVTTPTGCTIVDTFLVDSIYDDCHCHPYGSSIPNGSYDVNTSVTYNNLDHFVTQDIIVHTGAILTLNNCTLKFDPNAKLFIEKGAKVILNNNSLLTSACDEMWPGIEMDLTYNGNILSSAKPRLTIVGNSTIENAVTGILFYKAGILASNCNFIDNYIDVRKKKRWVDFHTTVTFYNVNFRTTNILLGPVYLHPKYHVQLNKAGRITFNNCEFRCFVPASSTTIPVNLRGCGIVGNKSYFTVENNTTFDNLEYAIYTNGFNDGGYITTIKNSTFTDNYRGILIEGQNNLNIIENDINTWHYDNNYTGADPQTFYQMSYGAYLSDCDNYTVENNEFIGNATDGSVAGMYINNSGYGENIIYRNNFHNFNSPQGNQRSSAFIALNNNGETAIGGTGLSIKCNGFNNSDYDIALIDATIKQNQGYFSISDPTAPAGNTFDYQAVGCGAQLDNSFFVDANSPQDIDYYFHSFGDITDFGTCHTLTKVDNQPTFQYFQEATACPDNQNPGGGGIDPIEIDPIGFVARSGMTMSAGGIGEIVNKINYLESEADTKQNELNSKIDKGNTVLLQTIVETASTDNYIDVSNNVSEISGFVSNEVITEFIKKDAGMPVSKTIALRNNSPLPEKAKKEIDNTELPASLKDYLKNFQNGKNIREQKEVEIKALVAQKQRVINWAIKDVLENDTTGEYTDMLISELNSKNDLFSKTKVYSLLVGRNRIDEAKNILVEIESLTTSFEQTQYENYANWISLQNLSLDLNNIDDSLQNPFIANNADLLFTIANNRKAKGKVQAQLLLEEAGLAEFPEFTPLPEQIATPKNMLVNSNNNANGTDIYENKDLIFVYPNPVKNILTVEYALLANTNIKSLGIYNLNGKLLKTIPISQQLGLEQINVSNFANGTYIISFGSDGVSQFNKKFTIKN